MNREYDREGGPGDGMGGIQSIVPTARSLGGLKTEAQRREQLSSSRNVNID